MTTIGAVMMMIWQLSVHSHTHSTLSHSLQHTLDAALSLTLHTLHTLHTH
jgi:hypothetical protein